ncbi:MAG: GTPase ObgE [Chlamydiae bacterium]|nr:GTPase ObgE [Chlamydiota bacterium]
MFVDTTTLTLTAGKGGNGVVAWRREKYIPKGGPMGGNGGRGGSIFLVADDQIPSLESYRHKRILLAEHGGSGGSNLKQGKAGKDLVLKVPCGTLVKERASGQVLFDLTEPGARVLLCQGGKPGKGNAHFKSPTNQAPNTCTPGTPGESKEVELELKLIADVGLVGIPNAGKSTFLSSAAYTRVKIGAYPFTTLFPNLAFVHYPDKSKLLIADIPGIIQGAHANRGLGLAFLKHIERTSVLVFLIDISGFEGRDPVEDFLTLRQELAAYRQDLLEKPFLVGLNKIDMEESSAHIETFYAKAGVAREKIFLLSAKEQLGIRPLLDAIHVLAFQQVPVQ